MPNINAKDLEQFFHLSQDLLCIADINGYFLLLNRPWETTLGYSLEELQAAPFSKLLHPEDVAKTQQESIRLVGGGISHNFENRFRCKDGSFVWLRWTAIASPDEQKIYAIARDITEEKLFNLVSNDPLTNLPNRQLLYHLFKDKLAPHFSDQTKMAVIICDIDHFRHVNNSLGHQLGDELLLAVSDKLQEWASENDLLARLEGDEFAVILTNVTDEEDIRHRLHELKKMLETPLIVMDNHLMASLSLGIAIFPDHADTIEMLFKHADLALYYAKIKGRNHFRFYSPKLSEQTQKYLHQLYELTHAFQHNNLEVYYQPQVDAPNCKIIGFEALLRWKKDGRFVPASEFIALAEETGHIVSIGNWVLQEACKQTEQWNQQFGLDLHIAVNLSERQFHSGLLLQQVQNALTESNINPAYLELEITESILMETSESIITLLNKLKSSGLSLALDDFGTGYSTLSYLSKFPIDKLKIDRVFINEIETDPRQKAITAAIINLARALNLAVLAEGIENEEQYHILQELDCNQMQGYWLGRPMPATKATALLAGQSDAKKEDA